MFSINQLVEKTCQSGNNEWSLLAVIQTLDYFISLLQQNNNDSTDHNLVGMSHHKTRIGVIKLTSRFVTCM